MVTDAAVTAVAAGAGGAKDGQAGSAMMAALEAEIGELRTALEAAEGERERLKGQLVRLKAQMLREQEEEEDKVGVRCVWGIESHRSVGGSRREAVFVIESRQHKLHGELRDVRSGRAVHERSSPWDC